MFRPLLVLSLFVSAGLGVSAQIHVDYKEPPASIEGLFERADVVVLAKILSRTEAVNGYSHPVTDYPVIILEKFKGDGSVPSKGPGLTVRRVGGLAKNNVEVGFPLFAAGDQYILFLEHRRDVEGLVPLFGPDGALKIEQNGLVVPLGYKVGATYRGKPSEGLITILRRLAS